LSEEKKKYGIIIGAGTLKNIKNPIYLGEIELGFQPVPESILCLSQNTLSRRIGIAEAYMIFNVDEVIFDDVRGFSPFNPATLILSAIGEKRMKKITENMVAKKTTR
jgi:hypothetical protein